MGRPRIHSEQSILAAARRVFIAEGADVDTRRIAGAAGVSQSLLFQRYGAKQALFFAAMLPEPPSLADLVGSAGETLCDDLSAMLLKLCDWLDGSLPGAVRAAVHPGFPDLIARSHATDRPQEITTVLGQAISDLIVRHGSKVSCSPEGLGEIMVELAHGRSLMRLVGGVGNPNDDWAKRRITQLLSLP